MSKPNMNAYKNVIIDGESKSIAPHSTIQDVVSHEVSSVEALTPNGGIEVIGREHFNSRQVPDGLTTHLTPIAKGSSGNC